MKITKIEKKKRLYLLEIDEIEKLYVTEDTIVRYMLTRNMTLEQELLEEIKDFAQFSYGKNLALYYLSFKARTTKEVSDYLKKYEIDDKRIPDILAHLEADKWLDDERYARQLFEQTVSFGDKGGFVLKQKLAQKGISKSILDDLLAEFDFEEVAVRVAEKYYRQYSDKLSHKGLEMKLIQTLMTKGFTHAEAKSALAQLELEKDEETELELIYKELDKSYRKYSRNYDGYDLKQRLVQALARKGFSFDTINQALRDYL